ncbi:Ig-like domain-containing protein [Pseudoduganella sp. OTU4001]|uniref:Ig-like domain-containing protein n=1 Tax=Pseudoduganella sp. OTU4001 TaxID=3043854 RepID=UPI00313A8665
MTNVLRKLSGWVGAFACASLLAACGGGGGSPGATPNNPDPTAPKAATIVVSASAGTIASSGQDGTEVTLTAQVKDANNRAVPGATVVFKASSGSISTSGGVTDSNGLVTEKLSTKGDATLRDIKISASVGSVTSNEIVVKVVQATQSLTLTTDSGTLTSSGAAGSEVTVTALVRDSNNSVMPGVRVDLAVDSGSLTAGTRITDSKGVVTEKLSTGNDATSRVIRITGTLAGLAPVTTTVAVVGTTVKVTANPTVNVGSSTDVTVKLTDSAGNALANKPVTFSSTANTLAVKGGGTAVTDAGGQLTLRYTATAVPAGGKDVITVRSMGESASTEVLVSSANFTVATVSGAAVANINTCIPLRVHSDNAGAPTSGSVMVASSRGTVYTDAACTSPQSVGVPLSGGDAVLYVRATSPGIATLTANIVGGGTAQGALEFVAPLLASSTITVQSDPAVVGANTVGSTSQQATIRAVVRDGTAANNLVKNAVVTFSIVSDASGGSLTQPAQVATGSDGSASVSYIAGTSATALDGVVISAQLQGASTASATTRLTVSKKSLFISAGTGREVATPSVTTYSKEYTVLVVDASGNAVPGVNVTASVWPRHFRKGSLVFPLPDGPWTLPFRADTVNGVTTLTLPFACPNEDANRNGVLDSGEDRNGNGRLDPGIPVAVTSSGTTNAEGRATVTLTYARDRALWTGVDLTIRGQVSGSEATYVSYIPILPGASPDYTAATSAPPGAISPYGETNTFSASDCNIAN